MTDFFRSSDYGSPHAKPFFAMHLIFSTPVLFCVETSREVVSIPLPRRSFNRIPDNTPPNRVPSLSHLLRPILSSAGETADS